MSERKKTFGDGLKVGDFALHRMGGRGRCTLVRIVSADDTKEGRRLGVSYTPCGGYSFSWPTSEFEPVVSALDKAICRGALARERLQDAKREQARAERDIAKWDGVVECLKSGEYEDDDW